VKKRLLALAAVTATGFAILHTPSGAQDLRIGNASVGCYDLNNCRRADDSGTYLEELSNSFMWNGGDGAGNGSVTGSGGATGYGGPLASHGDCVGGRCPGESVRQCREACHVQRASLEAGCRGITSAEGRALCWAQAMEWTATCIRNCGR
jgi:hypothetical protein